MTSKQRMRHALAKIRAACAVMDTINVNRVLSDPYIYDVLVRQIAQLFDGCNEVEDLYDELKESKTQLKESKTQLGEI